jgi:hypothetical protein
MPPVNIEISDDVLAVVDYGELNGTGRTKRDRTL